MTKEQRDAVRSLLPREAEAEFRWQRNLSHGITMVSGTLSGNARSEQAGISARVCRNGLWGFASISDDSPESVRAVLRAAEDNARFMERHIGGCRPPVPSVGGGSFDLVCALPDTEQRQYIDFCRTVDEYIVASCPRITGRTLSIRADSMEKLVTVSDGICSHTVLPRAYLYVNLTAETKAGAPVALMGIFGGHGVFENALPSAERLFPEIDRLYAQLMEKTEGVYPDAGPKTCILSGELSGMLAHEAVGHTVEADLVLGGSVAAHCLGKVVASPLVSITDFAHSAFGAPTPLPVYADDEGVASVDAPIIRDGILVGYLNNRETALHFNMKPTGNARAFAFSDEPLIRMRNTAILPGSSRLSDMIASVEDGCYLTNTGNGQADTTGEFMFGISMGYEIKKGKLGRALLDTTISGVAFEMLKTVDMVSDTVSWVSSGYCGKKQRMPVGLGGPAIRCRMMVGGK